MSEEGNGKARQSAPTQRGLVTGVAGFIGSALARALLDAGWAVRGVDNFFSGTPAAVPDGVELIEGDLRDPETAREACRGIDVVWHLAAARNVARSVEEPLLTETNNVQATLNLLMAAEEAGVRRVVYASSSSVYGDAGGPASREDQATDPRSPYAVSKLAAEQYCRVWTGIKGLSTVSLRYFNVFGPGQNPDSKYSAVFPGFVSALAEGRAPEVHWDGEQSRDFTFIDDVVRANMLAVAAGADADGEVLNIAGGGERTVNEVLKSVSRAVGEWIEPTRTPMRAGDVRRSRADISRAKQVIGWEPRAEWEASVEATVNWFLKERQAPARAGGQR